MLLRYKTNIVDEKIRQTSSKIHNILQNEKNVEDIKVKVYGELYDLYKTLLRPSLTIDRIGNVITKDEINTIIDDIVSDISCIKNETNFIAQNMLNDFNYKEDLKRSIKDRLSRMMIDISNSKFAFRNETSNIIYSENFSSNVYFDREFASGDFAYIDTTNKMATLSVKNIKRINENIEEITINGNGMYGENYGLIFVNQTLPDGTFVRAIRKENLYADKSALIDGNIATWFEYEMIGCKQEILNMVNNYDIGYVNSRDEKDELVMRILIKLRQTELINMISIEPLFLNTFDDGFIVEKIRLSSNGIDFIDLLKQPVILSKSINSRPHTYTGINNTEQSYCGNGIFVFKPYNCKVIEIILKQKNSVPYKFAHTHYKLYNITDGLIKDEYIRIPQSMVPQHIVDGPPMRYYLGSSDFDKDAIKELNINNKYKYCIEKNIDIIDGFRYAIAIRGIELYRFEFNKESEIITKKIKLQDNIKRLMIESDEEIPEDFIVNIKDRYDYIRYFISFDDVTWIEIAPTHRKPFGKELLPPSIITVNLANSLNNTRSYNYTSDTINEFRLKIVLKGVEDLSYHTPIIYNFRVVAEYGE